MIDTGKFWLEVVGVDGFWLDVAKHLYSKIGSAMMRK
jgi:glycosidase